MLDRWKMFAERSQLDITLTKQDPSWDTVVQIYVACNFCGKNISNTNRSRINKTGSLSRQQTSQQNKSKAQVYILHKVRSSFYLIVIVFLEILKEISYTK